MTKLSEIYGPGHTQAAYLRALATGDETGWWDHHGVPAPWPDNYDTDTDTEQPTINDDPLQNGDQPPF
jgi:hypothetical protein